MGEAVESDRSVRSPPSGTEVAMARTPAPDTRERILDNAGRLFREQGPRAVGMQRIIDECGCGKNLLYREFASKDHLIAAYLERCQQEWTAVMDEAVRPYADDPARQMVAMVHAAAAQVTAPDFTGCPFRITHAEFPDAHHPAHQVAVRHVKNVRARLRALAKEAHAPDPRVLADRILLIIDGLYINGAMLGPRPAASTAVALAEELVRDATGPTARR
jgi:AcrR family transcriptional regulator